MPFTDARTESHRAVLERWLRSYRPEELFDAEGMPVASIRNLHPVGDRRMSANPHANGGPLVRGLDLPDCRARPRTPEEQTDRARSIHTRARPGYAGDRGLALGWRWIMLTRDYDSDFETAVLQALPTGDLDSIAAMLMSRCPGHGAEEVRDVVYDAYRRVASSARIKAHLIPLALNRARTVLTTRPQDQSTS